MTGCWFDADEAHRWGLVNEIVPGADLMTRTWDLAQVLASGPPLVYAAIKDIVRDVEDAKFQDAMTGSPNANSARSMCCMPARIRWKGCVPLLKSVIPSGRASSAGSPRFGLK